MLSEVLLISIVIFLALFLYFSSAGYFSLFGSSQYDVSSTATLVGESGYVTLMIKNTGRLNITLNGVYPINGCSFILGYNPTLPLTIMPGRSAAVSFYVAFASRPIVLGLNVTDQNGAFIGRLVKIQYISFSSKRILELRINQVSMQVSGGYAYLTINVSNVGTVVWIGGYAYGYDDGGKKFTVAIPPLAPGETATITLSIPIGTANVSLDSSGNNLHGTLNGNGMWVPGLLDSCIYLTNGPYIEINDDSRLFTSTDLTIYAWVNRSDINDGGDVIFSDISWPNMEHSLELGKNYYIVFYTNDNDNPVSVSSSTGGVGTAGVWNNVAFTWDGETAYFFNNGSLIDSAPFTASPIEKTNLRHRIGRRTGGANPFNGCIDQFLLYHPSITQAELEFMYNNPDKPVTRNLVLWFTFDEGDGNPYSITSGNTYSIYIVIYTSDGLVKTATAQATAA